MKSKSPGIFIGLIFALSIISCERLDHCSGVDCMPPPFVGITFRVYNSKGENLIKNGTLTADNVSLAESGSVPGNPYILDDKSAFVFEFGEGERNYKMMLIDVRYDLTVAVSQTKRKNGECCSGFMLKSLSMDGQEIAVPENYVVDMTIK